MKSVSELRVKIFADGADKKNILEMQRNPLIKGFTTNPTLMYKAGVTNYEAFAKDVLSVIKDKSVSFEVLSDDFAEMRKQALKIASWGDNVYVKIPVMNTRAHSAVDLIRKLANAGVKQNVTALMTLNQVRDVVDALKNSQAATISIFAGRVADTGMDPIPIMKEALEILRPYPQIELIWASPRELLNIFQADEIGCHIITVTHDLLKKLNLIGKDLREFSLETVRMFYDDAMKAGLSLDEVVAV